MPIGKNAIHRVENNGYSNVVTEAPDMENSVVEPAPAAKSRKKKPAPTPTPSFAKEGFLRFEIGAELPVWLL